LSVHFEGSAPARSADGHFSRSQNYNTGRLKGSIDLLPKLNRKAALRMFRRVWFAIAFALVTGLLLPFQIVAVWVKQPAARRIPVLYHRCLARLIGLQVTVDGEPSRSRPLLIVANHVSWLDIVVLSSCAPVTFVAKREVAAWPVLGRLARLQQTVFIDRERKFKSGAATREIAGRMLAGHAVVLFAESTSSDGATVLPFRSALVGAAAAAMPEDGGGSEVVVQPLAVSYPRSSRGIAAWYGDMALLPHLSSVLKAGRIEVRVSWGASFVFKSGSDRKDVTRRLEQSVRSLKAAQDAEMDGVASQAA
jgi:1-acyl-sn-glycerol-3-phosphate acyltransferase